VYCAIVLGILRHLDIRSVKPMSPEHIFYMAHAMRYAAWHMGFSGDTVAVADYAIGELLDDDFHKHAAKLIKGLKPKVDLSKHVQLATGPGGGHAGGIPSRDGASTTAKQPSGSCEIAVVDKDGNWVQMMDTLQSGGIPGMVVEGVVMVGSHASLTQFGSSMAQILAPNARMRSVMGNTMVLKDGKPILSLGTPGNVHCTVPQMLTYLLDFKLEPYAAADMPRMLPFNEDGSITIEDRVSTATIDALTAMGVRVRAAPTYDFHMGSFQMCFRDPKTGELGASADPRRMGVADGIK
jgi:gamma-glutamyltranspeptidase/glutathione hydrolase